MTHLRILGAIDLCAADGRSLQSVLAQPKRLALLVYLALTPPGGFIRRDSLLALFWPESDKEHARNSLSQALHFLRRSLGEGVIVARGNEEVGLNPERLWCDATAFDEACEGGSPAQALELYRGNLLEGFHIPDAPEFERWLEKERFRLRELAARAGWTLAGVAEGKEDWGTAVDWARRAVALCPDDEGAVRRLINLLDRSGDRAGALHVYDDFARELAEQLDVEPAAETQALVVAIRARREPFAHIPSELPVARSARDETQTPIVPGILLRAVPSRRFWLRPAAAAALAVLVLTAGALAFQPVGGVKLVQDRVLVLPFENHTGDPTLDGFGRVASDWITQGLVETGMAEVVDPMTAVASARSVTEAQAAAGAERLRAFAEATRAGTVVSGSYYQRGDSIQVQVKVTDAQKSEVLRTVPPVSGPRNNPLAAIEEIRPRVLGALSTLFDEKLASLSTTSSQPPSYEAYLEYTEGLDFFVRNDYEAALPRLYRAREMDSTFVLPLFWAAFVHGNSGRFRQADSVIQIVARSRDRLSPLDRHGLDYFLASSRWDWDATSIAAQNAASLAPESNWAYLVAYTAERRHRPRQAIRALAQLDPTRGWLRGWHIYWAVLTQAHHMLGGHRSELKEAQRARHAFPEMPRARTFEVIALAALGRTDELHQKVNEAIEEVDPLHRHGPGYMMVATARELQTHGYSQAARNVLHRSATWHRGLAPDVAANERNRWTLATTLYLARQLGEAKVLCENLAREQPSKPQYLGCLGIIAARQGRPAEAEEIFNLLNTRFSSDPFSRFEQARIAALLGQRERAVTLLREAVEKRINYTDAHAEPDFESLRSQPGFQKLLKPKG